MAKAVKSQSVANAQRVAANAAATVLRDAMARFMGQSHGGDRDLWGSFGYPLELQVGHLYALYERGDIANRIVRMYPASTWREDPIVKDDAGDSSEPLQADGDANPNFSPFSAAFKEFAEKHSLFAKIERADRLSSIGRFGLLFLGFNDGAPASQPLSPGKHELLYMVPYSEVGVQVSQWETNPKEPRFGLPLTYSLQNRPISGGPVGPANAMSVHHSRVIHISEFLDGDEVYGQPRLKCVFNRLADLEKVVGGGAEMFWLSAARSVLFSVDKDVAALDDTLRQAMKDEADEFTHGLRRTLIGQGMTAQTISGSAVDPEPHVASIMDLIAGATGIPKRILLGTERGELASSQDENNWALRIDERRKHFAGPMLLKPIIQKLIDTGNLPQPKGEFKVEWPKHDGLDPSQAADVNLKKAQTLTTYANSPGAELIMPMPEFRSKFLGLEPESEYEVPVLEDLLDENDPNLQDQPEDAGGAGAPAEEDPPAEDPEEEKEPAANASKPRTLYMHRKLLPGTVSQIQKWFEKSGLTGLQDDLHVTIAYSRTPFDWTKIRGGLSMPGDDSGELHLPAGGVRILEPIGPAKVETVNGETVTRQALALLFVSDALAWRHMDIMDAGASHDFEDYQPHITLTYDPQTVDIAAIKPFQGPILLGPEDFGEIDR